MTDEEKLLQYLFLNLAFLLDRYKQTIHYGAPYNTGVETGMAVTMFYIDNRAYEYAAECLTVMGKPPCRECGVTSSVTFETTEETDAFRNEFKSRVEQAKEQLAELDGKTPQEYFFLKTNPIIKDIKNTENNHFIYLQANIIDDLDRRVCKAVLGEHEIIDMTREITEIKVVCWRKKWRDRLAWCLRKLGVDG